MKSNRYYSRRDQQAEAATHSAAPVFETLEGRALMSVTPSVGPMEMMSAGPAAPSMHAPLVVSITAAKSGMTSVVPGTGVVNPGGTGGTVSAKRSLWDRLKGAAKWAKDHIVIGLHHIGIKGTF